MEPSVTFGVLRELEVLFEAQGAGDPHALPPLTALAEGPLAGEDHVFHAHTPLWAFEHPFYAYPYAAKGLPPVYETLPPDLGVAGVLDRTRFVVFLGAVDSPTFRRCLERPETFLLILEPDARRLARFTATVPAARLAKRAVILLGDPDGFVPPVARVLPPELFHLGFPVFYGLPGFRDTPQAARLVELVEILFYRHSLYALSGQANVHAQPIRDLARGLFFDQQQHSYANAVECLRWPDIRALRKAFPGETAVLVAAGPDLPERLDYLRSVRGRAVVIAVNNALKPLAAAGVLPHFVVANDTSVHTARSWEGLPPLPGVALVGHCLSDLGGEVFGRKYLFGTHRPEVYGKRPDLRLHGSVISTAFSLARYMGCARCVFVGAQLCSPDPWSLRYSRGSIHEAEDKAEAKAGRALTNAWPQLVPVTTLGGQARYTTLNFLDAAHWLRDEIRLSGIPCVNSTQESIISGPGVAHVPDCPVEPTGRLERCLASVAAAQAPNVARGPVLAHLRRELALWRSVAAGVEGIVARQGADFLAAATKALEQFDKGNVSYLVQRFEGFDNRLFQATVLEPAPEAEKARGLRAYLDAVGRMARHFEGMVTAQLARLG